MPWRNAADPYRIWLSEVILQQTRVEQGTPYYERFVAAFPTVEALAAAPEPEVLKLWEGLGYYTRARNLHRAAKLVVAENGGQFPESAAELVNLPGVGRYTAAAIASIAHGEPVAVLDGNVMRVLARVHALKDCIDDGPVRARLWDLAQELVAPRSPGDFNQAMMELGATVCTPVGPQCHACPVREDCAGSAAGIAASLPVRREKPSIPHHEMVAVAIKRRGKYLVGQRPDAGLLGGLWELPNGRVLAGERHQDAVLRVARDVCGLQVTPGGLIASVRHAYSHFRITLTVYGCREVRGRAGATEHSTLQWVPPEAFASLAFPRAHHKFLHLLP